MKTLACLSLIISIMACRPAPKDEPVPGPPGTSCSTSQLTTGSMVTCTDGTYSIILNGKDGSSCTTERLTNGARIDCDNGSHSVVLDGPMGSSGPQGEPGIQGNPGERGNDAPVSAYNVVEVISPCPDPGYREVLLRLANGQILAHFSNGAQQFLSLIGPGDYILTDGSSCRFNIDNNGVVRW